MSTESAPAGREDTDRIQAFRVAPVSVGIDVTLSFARLMSPSGAALSVYTQTESYDPSLRRE
jgi:hypothetical protein